jgi:hypothetical protein
VSLSLVRGSKSTQTTCEPFRTCSHPHPGLLLQARGSSVGMGWGGGISGKGPLARKRRLSLRERERNRARRVPFSSLGDPELPGSRLPQPQGGGGEPPSPSPRRLARALPAPARHQSAFRPSIFGTGPVLSTPGSVGKLWRWFPLAGGWECPR